MLLFDENSVINSVGGTISVTAQISWTGSAMPNGVIISQTVTISSFGGTVVFFNESVGVSVTGLNVVIAVQPNEMYFATVRITNGRGSSDANTSQALSPQGGEWWK